MQLNVTRPVVACTRKKQRDEQGKESFVKGQRCEAGVKMHFRRESEV